MCFINDLIRFISRAPTAFHAAVRVADELAGHGFVRLDERESWPFGAGRFVLERDGAVVAWVVPQDAGSHTPLRIVGAHTDSPGFKLKPNPSYATAGVLQAGVEVYGGPLLNSWLDRELAIAGRLVTADGATHLVATGPLARIPQLAIHLDREQNDGLTLDRQRHLQPIWGVGGGGDILVPVGEAAGVPREAICGHDLMLVDAAPPARFGADAAFLASGRLDNLSSVWAGVHALATVADRQESGGQAPGSPPHISMLAAFDHEELGSESRSGASGPLLADVLARIAVALDANPVERQRAHADSWLVSADAGHAVHPNYADKHDPQHRPVLGGGPLLKVNAGQRYATDGRGAALWAGVCRRAGVPFQTFVSNNAVPCGSTIGPLAATRLGIRTLDVGAPLLSMHSARELAHVGDLQALGSALAAFLAG